MILDRDSGFSPAPPRPIDPTGLSVENIDGKYSQVFSKDGRCEVWLFGELGDERRVMIGLGFASIRQGERAGAILHDAVDALKAIAAEPVLTEHDGHEHELRPVRYSRTLPIHLVCELCGAIVGRMAR